jgi:hypothetical protein
MRLLYMWSKEWHRDKSLFSKKKTKQLINELEASLTHNYTNQKQNNQQK